MIAVSQLQRFNAEFVRDSMWPSVPPKRVICKLARFRGRLNNGNPDDYTSDPVKIKEIDCKTIACFGGWVALNPYFQSLGVRSDQYGAPYMQDILHAAQVSGELFGDYNLFNRRSYEERGSDHTVVMKRIKKLIDETYVIFR